MKKLLHERLREWVHKADGLNYPTSFALKEMGLIGATDNAFEDEAELFSAMADEIERDYIPRPRFEDDEPVQWGEQVPHNNQSGSWKMNRICLTESGYYFNDHYHSIKYAYDEPVKRPQPKVLDADGVEIKVGDTVWSVQNGKQAVVSDIGQFETEYSKGNVMFEGISECYMGTLFTHKEPVLDADGIPINVGDTVWSIEGNKLEVKVIDPSDDPECQDRLVWCGEYKKTAIGDIKIVRIAKDLTHKEPDSLKKLRDDMREWFKNGGICSISDYIDRLSALIERGA